VLFNNKACLVLCIRVLVPLLETAFPHPPIALFVYSVIFQAGFADLFRPGVRSSGITCPVTFSATSTFSNVLVNSDASKCSYKSRVQLFQPEFKIFSLSRKRNSRYCGNTSPGPAPCSRSGERVSRCTRALPASCLAPALPLRPHRAGWPNR